MTSDPGVHQHVARPRVKALNGSSTEVGKIGNAADVDDDAMNCRVGKHGLVEGRNQGRTLAAGGNIPAAEVTYDGGAGQLC